MRFPHMLALLIALAAPAVHGDRSGRAAAAPQVSGQQPAPPSQAKPAVPPAIPSVIPPEAAQKSNPVKATPESVEAGKRLFVSQCAMCHGTEGDGKGDLAVELKWEVKDWRNPEALKDKTDGALFYLLTAGKGHMPGQEKRMTDTQKWNLVNFIRSLAKETKKEEKKPGQDQP
ncbi:MAG TPA: c-type cytochrome [Candidatus Acidoferrales bacterium]